MTPRDSSARKLRDGTPVYKRRSEDLSGQLREREQTIDKQDDLLSHDRDIRDLMGARDLYIAEVYDVARDGATQKPYGRKLFYTKGKSLIFYAYDLNQESWSQERQHVPGVGDDAA